MAQVTSSSHFSYGWLPAFRRWPKTYASVLVPSLAGESKAHAPSGEDALSAPIERSVDFRYPLWISSSDRAGLVSA